MFARTQRLLLRPGWIEDAPALFEAISDEAIVRNLSKVPWPYSIGHAEAFLSADRGPGEVALLIFRRTQGAPELVGTVGFGARPDGDTEFGYWIGRAFWGRGYATEAGRAALALARDSLQLKRLASGHFTDNPASGRVLEKLGFRPTGLTEARHSAGRGEAVPCRLFELELAAEEADEPAATVMAA